MIKAAAVTAVLIMSAALAGCGGNNINDAAAGSGASVAATEEVPQRETPQYIVFNDESISLEEYASLIAFYEQLSFDNAVIEDESDFIDAAEQYDMEHLYALYEFINSLSAEEAGELHRTALEALNS